MFPKKESSKVLNLQKKNLELSEDLNVVLECLEQQTALGEEGPNLDTYNDCEDSEVNDIVFYLTEKLKEAELDVVGPCEDSGTSFVLGIEEAVPPWTNDVTPITVSNEEKCSLKAHLPKSSRWNMDHKVLEFIELHSEFTIKNSIESFEIIELIEHGLNRPYYHTEYVFPKYKPIDTGIDLQPVLKGSVNLHACRAKHTLMAIDEDNVLELYHRKIVRVYGKINVSFRLKDKIEKIKKVNKTVCMFTKSNLITFDLVNLQKWGILPTDVTENNLGEFIILENYKTIKVFKNLKLVQRVELNVLANGIVSWYDRKVVVHSVFKVLFILDLDEKQIEIISGPSDRQLDSFEIYKNVLVMKGKHRLTFFDLVNKKKYISHYDKDFKYTVGDVVRVYDFKDNFRYFELANPLNNFSVTYNERITEFDAYKNVVYLNIGEYIKIYKNGLFVEEIKVCFYQREMDFTNVIFVENDFDSWKSIYNKIKKEKLEFLPNDLNRMLKEDVDKILGREAVKSLTLDSQKGSVISQKRKKGGF